MKKQTGKMYRRKKPLLRVYCFFGIIVPLREEEMRE